MSDFTRSFSELAKAAMGAASSALGKKSAQNEAQKAQYDALQQEIYRNRLYDYFKDDYSTFAGGFKNCLESNYSRLGVSCPRRVEDVYCDKRDRVDGTLFPDGSYQDISFSFDAKLEAKNINLSTISSGSYEYEHVDVIERRLREELPKYVGDYHYRDLKVIESADSKIKVAVYGVDCPPKQIPYWGPYICY